MRVITLSTIPPRFHMLGPTLKSLVNQKGPVDEIRLYVPHRYRRFPDYDGIAVPSVPEGVTLVRPADDLGPASKVLFAARDLRGTDSQILFCDDDRIFAPDWARSLFDAQDERPDECVALVGKDLPGARERETALQPRAVRGRRIDLEYGWRRLRQQIASRLVGGKGRVREMRRPVRRAGYVDILQGLGGAVVRPQFFDDIAYDIPDVLWTVDDYWLSGLLAWKGIGIWLPAWIAKPAPTAAHGIESLYHSTIEGADRTEANQRCVDYLRETFGVWR